jgi:hypothetical protein
MTSITDASLVEQRQMLCRQLQAQRQLITQQLSPTPEVNSGYPRSMTMRFLTRQPGLATGLFGELATLLVGARYIKSIISVIFLARIVRSASTSKLKTAL